nr:hypothetical protein [Myxococcota bacterium]
ACVHLAGEAAPRCVVTDCAAERLDCNLDPADGCEANFCRDLAHCSACFGYRGRCDAGICLDGRCAPSSSSFGLASGIIVRARDGAPIAGASVSRARECGTPTITTSSATGSYEVGWDFDPQFVLVRTEAAGYATQIDGASSWADIRLIEVSELDALLAASPVPVDRRLGIVVVDAPGAIGVGEVVEPVVGVYRAPAIAASPSYVVPLTGGWVRQVFVDVRPGTARVRVGRAGDSAYTVECNEISATHEGAWDAPVWHDTVVSGDAIVHVRFGWCRSGLIGG